MLEKNAKGIIAQGTPEQMKTNTENPYVYNFFNRKIEKDEK
jgi:phospholipid/cholesterol/gamma-HCH transport system ATP-binding protein